MITYRKTKTGEWVAYGTAPQIIAGATVTVTKRDGTTKQERIESVGKSFLVNGQAMRYGYLAAATTNRSRTGTSCRSSHMCDECYQRPGNIPRRDSSGIAGYVCTGCNRSADYELSFA